MTPTLDRRQFLLGSAAATGALALSGCAGLVPRSETAAARALYDSIFEGMLRAAPEMATGLGLDTGERAYLKSRLSDSSPAGKMGAYQPLLDHLPQLRRIDRGAAAGPRARLARHHPLARRAHDRGVDLRLWRHRRLHYPVPYVLSQLTGAYQSVPDFLDSQHEIETRDDAEAYVARLEEFAAQRRSRGRPRPRRRRPRRRPARSSSSTRR